MGAQLDILKRNITSLSTTLYCIADCFNKVKVISSTLTPIVPLIPLTDPPSHPKPVSSNITSFNTLGNQEYNSTTTIAYFLLIRDNLSNSFSSVKFSISAQ